MAESSSSQTDIMEKMMEKFLQALQPMQTALIALASNYSQPSSVPPKPFTITQTTDPITTIQKLQREFPRFGGGDPSEWLYKADTYFRFHNISDNQKLIYASMHLDGAASSWFQWMEMTNQVHTWTDFVIALKVHFGHSFSEDPIAAFTSLVQQGLVPESQLDFQMLYCKNVNNKRCKGKSGLDPCEYKNDDIESDDVSTGDESVQGGESSVSASKVNPSGEDHYKLVALDKNQQREVEKESLQVLGYGESSNLTMIDDGKRTILGAVEDVEVPGHEEDSGGLRVKQRSLSYAARIDITETATVSVEFFKKVDPTPIVSASILKVHGARLRDFQQEVVIEVFNPGIDDTLVVNMSLVYLTTRNLKFFNTKELGVFSPYVEGRDYAHVLFLPLNTLCPMEETCVKDAVVESWCRNESQMKESDLVDWFIPLMTRVADGEWFTVGVYACGLFSIAYPCLSKIAKIELRPIYNHLCQDDMSMVRRSVASNLGILATTIASAHLKSEIMQIFEDQPQDDQHYVRLLVVAEGNAAYKKTAYEEATAHYNRASELEDHGVPYITNWAAVYLEMGQYEEFLKACDKAVKRGRDMQNKDEGLGRSDKSDWNTLKATISFLNTDTFCYTSCPLNISDRQCSKKLRRTGHSRGQCDRCNPEFDECNYRSLIIQVQDHTRLTWMTAFQETGEEIFGGSAKEHYQLKYKEQNDDGFEKMFKNRGDVQEQLMLERDPHGNVQVAKIETEKMLILRDETEFKKRKQEGAYKGEFTGQSHFFGFATVLLLLRGKTELLSSVGNISAPVEELTIGETTLTSLIKVERRHREFNPVIKKALVKLEGKWCTKTDYEQIKKNDHHEDMVTLEEWSNDTALQKIGSCDKGKEPVTKDTQMGEEISNEKNGERFRIEEGRQNKEELIGCNVVGLSGNLTHVKILEFVC